MKTVRQIVIRGNTATIFYTWDRHGSGGKNPSRQIKTLSKVVSLEKLQASGALDLERMEEDLR